ncbi:MAG: IS1634 family transposase, partial [Burkholderiales bacterium]|nr:IS1634 family transposase [Burkholderiales bacterium]
VLLGRAPVYALEEWATSIEPAQLRLTAAQISLLNDDRVGRALDELFDADRASLLTEVVVRAVQEFHLDLEQLHNDSTTVTFSGEYRGATTQTLRRGKQTLAITHGHNKDHRPDLKQLLFILTISADGAVPVHYRAADGNTTDDQTHIHTWDTLRELLGRADFLYVADSKLCTREALTHIASHGGRFLTVLPRTRREDRWFRDWVQTHTPHWQEVRRAPHPRRHDGPPQIYRVTDAPMCSAEGYRIVWVYSSQKAEQDQRARQGRIEKGILALEALETRLRAPRCRFRTRAAVAQGAASALSAAGAQRWVAFTVDEMREDRFHQARRGRP